MYKTGLFFKMHNHDAILAKPGTKIDITLYIYLNLVITKYYMNTNHFQIT